MNGWTPERRARQSQAIRRWRPWDRSTGPRTPQGKAQAAQNAYKGGRWRVEREVMKELRQALREQRGALPRVDVSRPCIPGQHSAAWSDAEGCAGVERLECFSIGDELHP